MNMTPSGIPRHQRVAAQINEILADLLVSHYADPRLRLVTITEVEVGRDLSQARVWVGSIDPNANPEAVLLAIRHAGGRLRADLAKRLRLRTVPRLKFEWDDRSARSEYLEQLISRGLPREKDGEK